MDEQRVEVDALRAATDLAAIESSSVFGGPRGPLGTPRAVNIVTPAVYRDRLLDGVRELAAFAPGLTAPARFGRASVPNLRGDTGETYLGGQRRSYNLFGYLPSFNAVEAVEIVRGPAAVVGGPAPFSGGWVNYLPKTAPVGGPPRTEALVRVGSWVPDEPGRSHFQTTLRLDHGASFAPAADDSRTGWRVSLEAVGGRPYHHRSGAEDERFDAYLAGAWMRADGTARWDVHAQFQWQNTPQLNGLNRPSPELIRSGRYQPGAAPQVGGTLTGLLPNRAPVELEPDATLHGRDDASGARVAVLQSVLQLRPSPGTFVTLRTLAEGVDRHRYHAFEYTEYVRQALLEQRLELRRVDGRGESLAGATVRWEGREAHVNYFNEYLYAFDLSGPPGGLYAVAEQYPGNYFPGRPGRGGRLVFSASDGLPEGTRSHLLQLGLFVQREHRLGPGWTVLAGGRGDLWVADAEDVLPARPGRPRWADRHDFRAASGLLSLLWQPAPGWLAYGTFNRAAEINLGVTGGTVLLSGPLGRINRDDFDGRSTLWEAGLKHTWDAGRGWAALTGFAQRRSRPEFGGGRNQIEVVGLEAEVAARPGAWELAATLGVAEGRFRDSAPFQLGGRSIYALYPAGEGPGGRGTGEGYDFFFARQVPRGDWHLTGFPDWTVTGRLGRQLGAGWRAALDLRGEGGQRGNLDDEWRIPVQWTAALQIGWSRGPWTVEVDVLNLTHERAWIHNGDTFTNTQLVARDLPRRVEATVRRSW